MSIMVKELVPIDCAAAVWGPSWTGLHVLCYCDNMSVVHVLNKGSSREPSGVVMHSLRTLTFFSAIFGFVLRAQHVAGLDNGPADVISRDNLSLLFSQVPNAAREPTPIPEELWTCWWESSQTGSPKGGRIFSLLFAEGFGQFYIHSYITCTITIQLSWGSTVYLMRRINRAKQKLYRMLLYFFTNGCIISISYNFIYTSFIHFMHTVVYNYIHSFMLRISQYLN